MLYRLAVLLAGLALCITTARAGSVEPPSQVGGAYSIPVRSLKELRFGANVRQQFDFSCGSAALATLLTHHYRHPVTEQEVFEEMYVRGNQEKIRREGFSLLDIKLYLERRGYLADGFEVDPAKLDRVTIPAIVLINQRGYHHFVVLKGMRDGRVLIGDPSGGTRAVSRAEFEKMWVNRILFVIRNKQEVALFNADTDWRTTPRAPLSEGISRDGLGAIVLPKHGPGGF